jgi:transposase-like protein
VEQRLRRETIRQEHRRHAKRLREVETVARVTRKSGARGRRLGVARPGVFRVFLKFRRRGGRRGGVGEVSLVARLLFVLAAAVVVETS